MALERELKYSSPEGTVPTLAELNAALAALDARATDRGRITQNDVYYDDAESSVQGSGMALRVRSVPGARLATLKSRGSVIQGLHERSELEVPMAGGDAAPPPWPPELKERLPAVQLDRLEPRMLITTTRHRFHVVQGGAALAELAFDEVRCRPAPTVAATYAIEEVLFHEVELEALAAGGGPAVSAERLAAFGEALQELLPLYPSDITKLERAATLLAAFAE